MCLALQPPDGNWFRAKSFSRAWLERRAGLQIFPLMTCSRSFACMRARVRRPRWNFPLFCANGRRAVAFPRVRVFAGMANRPSFPLVQFESSAGESEESLVFFYSSGGAVCWGGIFCVRAKTIFWGCSWYFFNSLPGLGLFARDFVDHSHDAADLLFWPIGILPSNRRNANHRICIQGVHWQIVFEAIGEKIRLDLQGLKLGSFIWIYFAVIFPEILALFSCKPDNWDQIRMRLSRVDYWNPVNKYGESVDRFTTIVTFKVPYQPDADNSEIWISHVYLKCSCINVKFLLVS